MKKIYITALHLKHGGVEMAISLLANAFVRRGYKVEILCVYNLGDPSYEIDSEVKITYLTDVVPNREAFFKEMKNKNIIGILSEGIKALKVLCLKHIMMKKKIQEIKSGIIISTRNEHSVLLSRYGQDEVLKIAQLHHDHNFEKKYIKSFKYHYTHIDWFVVLTGQLRDEIIEMIRPFNKKTKCIVIPNFLADKEEKSADIQKEKTVVAVGRLHPVKGFDRLLDIWKQVEKVNSGWRLKIIGGGETEEELEKKIKDLQIQDSVTMMGMCSHDVVERELKRASLYVMTSYSEAFPFVLIEAMEAGTPVVAFDVRVGPRAIIEDGKNGCLIKDNDRQAFAEKMNWLLSKSDIRMQMSMSAIKRANEFSENAVMKKWESIIGQSYREI